MQNPPPLLLPAGFVPVMEESWSLQQGHLTNVIASVPGQPAHPTTLAAEDILLMELQRHQSTDASILQHAAGAFSLLQMMEDMLIYPPATPSPAHVPPTATREVLKDSSEGFGSVKDAGQSHRPIKSGSAEELLRDVHKKNSDLRSLLITQRQAPKNVGSGQMESMVGWNGQASVVGRPAANGMAQQILLAAVMQQKLEQANDSKAQMNEERKRILAMMDNEQAVQGAGGAYF